MSKKVVKQKTTKPATVDYTNFVKATTLAKNFVPTEYKQITELSSFEFMEKCSNLFTVDAVLQNIMLTATALACKKLINKSTKDEPNTTQKVFDQIAEDLDLISIMRWMFLGNDVYGISYPVILWGRKKYKFGTQTKELTVPVGITAANPINVRQIQTPFNIKPKICLKVSQSLADMYQEKDIEATNKLYLKPLFLGKLDTSKLDFARHGISIGDTLIEFNPEVVSQTKAFGAQPWDTYPKSAISGAFNAVQRKLKYIEADVAVADGYINSVLLARIGTDNIPAKPIELDDLNSALATAPRTSLLVGDHRLSLEFIVPSSDLLNNNDKYANVNDEIREGLGFSFLNTGSKGRRDVDKIMRLFLETIDAKRRNLLRWLKIEVYDEIIKLNNLKAEVRPEFNKISLAVDEVAKALVGLYRDRGMLSIHTALELIDEDYEQQKELLQSEKADEEIFKPKEKENFPNSPGSPANNNRQVQDLVPRKQTTLKSILNAIDKEAEEELKQYFLQKEREEIDDESNMV